MATKVFVGNLSFKIGEEKLRDEFSVAGNVLSANIITRGPRSLGYGFVEFASLADAENSVKVLNQKDIDGRKINVEVARPRTEPLPQGEKEGASDAEQGRRRRPRRQKPKTDGAPGSPGAAQQAVPSGGQQQHQRPRQQQQQGGPRQQDSGKRQYRPRPQGQNAGNANGQTRTNTAGRNNDNGVGDANERPFRPRYRRNRNQSGGGQQQQQQPQQQQQSFQRKRPAPQPKKQQERVPSPTTLFVANLPFSVDDKELAEIFSKNHKVAKAHVVKKRNTRSKGFGFVEFEDEAAQQAALKEFDGATVHERVLNVKVALTPVEGEHEDAPGTEKPAAAGGEESKHAAPEEKKEVEAPKAVEPAKESKAEAAAPAAGAAEGEEKKGGQ